MNSIPLRSGDIDYQNESITPTFFMCNFAILLVKILKSHPCPKWSRVSPQPDETKPKCTSGLFIHVVKGFGWWFVDSGFIFWFMNSEICGKEIFLSKNVKNKFCRPRLFTPKKQFFHTLHITTLKKNSMSLLKPPNLSTLSDCSFALHWSARNS